MTVSPSWSVPLGLTPSTVSSSSPPGLSSSSRSHVQPEVLQLGDDLVDRTADVVALVHLDVRPGPAVVCDGGLLAGRARTSTGSVGCAGVVVVGQSANSTIADDRRRPRRGRAAATAHQRRLRLVVGSGHRGGGRGRRRGGTAAGAEHLGAGGVERSGSRGHRDRRRRVAQGGGEARPSGNRSSGVFDIARRTTAASGAGTSSGRSGTGSRRCISAVATAVSATNGRRPARHSNATTPSE